MALAPKTVRVCGWGVTQMGRLQRSTTELQSEALSKALKMAGLSVSQLGGLIAVPSLSHPRFMEAHHLATQVGLLPHRSDTGEQVICRTVDTGGAGPITGLLSAARLIRDEWAEAVAVVAGDAVSSMSTAEFLARADAGCQNDEDPLPSPVIPLGYDRVAQWHTQRYGVSRAQLAMCSVLMSHQAQRHPLALCRSPHTLQEVLDSRPVGKVTNILECARRADGAGALVLASSRFMDRLGLPQGAPVLISGGEGSGPLNPPPLDQIDEAVFSCDDACKLAYNSAQLGPEDIDFFGLYDCFPICFLRALEAAGVCEVGKAGEWVEDAHRRVLNGTAEPLPINTHGGLLAYGAPWETPAIYNAIEACAQITGTAEGRQLPGRVRRALVYGNGGIFSASAVAVLGSGRY